MSNLQSFQTLRHTMSHKVICVRNLTEDTYVLRCSRSGLNFISGQHISVGPRNDLNMREYSVYSGTNEDFLEILVKEIKEGLVSKELKRLKENEEVKIEGPFGSFIISDEDASHPLYMVATGTGISPSHCFALSYPDMSFTVLHGVAHAGDLYEKEVFDTSNIHYIPCLSQDNIDSQPLPTFAHPFQGRVTHYLRNTDVALDGIFYLCGNCDMIYEAFDILQGKGVPPENIRAEVYF